MRICNVCQNDLPLESYHNVKSFPLGKAYTCKECAKERTKRWNRDNPDKKKVLGAADYAKNTELYLERACRRHLRSKHATPPWLSTEQRQQISDLYKTSRQLFKETGIKYHVDHIIPLQGKDVCGLHVPWNLQLLPASENLLKSNKILEAIGY